MKPIEEGCLAVIINSSAGNEGVSVTVGKFQGDNPIATVHGKSYRVIGENFWEVNKNINLIHCITNIIIEGGPNVVPEMNLLRIDGYQGSKQKVKEKGLTTKA